MSNRFSYKAWFYTITNCILLFLAFVASEYNIILPCIYTGILLMYLSIEKTFQIINYDFVIVGLFIFELFLESFSTGVNNGTPFILNQYLFTIYYFILRISITNRKIRQFFLSILSVVLGCISLMCFVSFGIFKKSIVEAGFENLYDFKYLYHPFGGLNNVWSSIFLVFLGIGIMNILIRKTTKQSLLWGLPVLPICYCLIVSFSRGIYIVLAILCIVFILGILRSKLNMAKRICVINIFIISLFLLMLPHHREVIRTIKFIETTSQQRSLNTRLNSFSLLAKLDKYPLLGAGTNNYSLTVNQEIYENDNNSFTNFAPNILSQLIMEKGIMGTLLWGSSILALLWMFFVHRKEKGKNTIITFSMLFIIIFILRELSFPAFFATRSLQISVVVIIANFINQITYRKRFYLKIKLLYLYISIVALFSIVLCFYLVSQWDLRNYNLYLSCIQKKQFDRAEIYLSKTRKITPTYIYYGCLNWLRYKESGMEYYALKADMFFDKALQTSPNDIRLIRNRAIILYALDKKAEAKIILSNLIDKFPNNTLFHIDLGNILFEEGETESASLHYAKAIKLTPSLLESYEWNQLLISDSIMASKITMQLKELISDIPQDPILAAKYGKLYWLLDNTFLAKKYLTYAIENLPNLSHPWYYLKEIALKENDMISYMKYKCKSELWAEFSQRQLQEGNKELNKSKIKTIWNNFWFSTYSIKFAIWYGVPRYSNVIDVTF